MGVIRPEALHRKATGLDATGRREGSNGNIEHQNHLGHWFDRKNPKPVLPRRLRQ